MRKEIAQAALRTFAELLKVQSDMTDQMETLEKFDQVFGTSIPDWETRMKELLEDEPDTEDAVKAIDAFYAKYHVYDEAGNLVYERMRAGNGHHAVTITFDSSAPEGQQITVTEQPDLDSMGLEELKEYYSELETVFDELESEEPDEDSEEYDRWEDELSDLETLMQEVEERIDALESR